MQTTYERVLTFDGAAKGRAGQKTKLSYAIERVMKSYAKQMGDLYVAYQDKLTDLNIEHCSVDERGNIIEPMVYTKEAQRARLKGQREALRALMEAAVEVEPYTASSLPEDLTDAEREAFAGFVLPESTGEEPTGEEFIVQPDGDLKAEAGAAN